MQIVRILNNSTAVIEENNQEIIVMGKGLVFGKKIGDRIESNKVEKKYVMTNNFIDDKVQALFDKISMEDSSLSFDLIEYFKQELPYSLNDSLYLSLMDHISFAVERAKKKMYSPNAILDEIKLFYPKEFSLGKWAVEKINQRRKVKLSEDEAGFIAIHLINARWFDSEHHLKEGHEKVIHDVIHLLSDLYQRNFSQETLSYRRLSTHLKYFLLREIDLEQNEQVEYEFYDQIIKEYPDAFKGALRTSDYLATFLKRKVSKEEKVFLTIHINRILND